MIAMISVILFVSLFSTINNSILPISNSPVAAEMENNEDEEIPYFKFASQIVRQSDNSSTVNTTTQLPEAAKGPPIPTKGYLVQQIGDGLYWLTDGAYQTMFMVTDKGVVAVDAPATIGNNYLKAIAEVTTKPVTHVIYSHAHIDHIGAAGIFPTDIKDSEVHLLNTGHFPLEEDLDISATLIKRFLSERIIF